MNAWSLFISENSTKVRSLFASHDTAHLHYHSPGHTQEVLQSVIMMAKALDLSEKELALLQVSALWHDVGYLYTYHGHEDKGMELSAAFLSETGCAAADIALVAACIEATKLMQEPRNELEALLSDADLAYGVTEHFFERGPLLRKEWELCLDKHYSELEWEKLQANFLSTVQFHSTFGKTNFAPIVAENLKKQQIRLDALLKE